MVILPFYSEKLQIYTKPNISHTLYSSSPSMQEHFFFKHINRIQSKISMVLQRLPTHGCLTKLHNTGGVLHEQQLVRTTQINIAKGRQMHHQYDTDTIPWKPSKLVHRWPHSHLRSMDGEMALSAAATAPPSPASSTAMPILSLSSLPWS